MREEYEREAERYRQELERVRWRLDLLRREARHRFSYELRDKICRYAELETEMQINMRAMRKRYERQRKEEQAERKGKKNADGKL